MSANPYLTIREREILEDAVVGIAGAGGLGSNCAAHLVRAGIKHLILADFDVVAESNLNRQFFFRDQIGQKKVEALRDNLLRIEPDLNLEIHDVRLDKTNIVPLFAHADILAEAFDVAEAKTMLLQTVLPTGKTIVSVSGIAGWGHSNSMEVKTVGANLILLGDFASGVDAAGGLAPASPRVGIAAAMQANSIIARLLGLEP